MSKKASAEATAPEETKRPPEASFDSFEGEEVNLPDIDGWYSPVEGEKGWVGRVVGQFRMKDDMKDDEGKERDIVVVRLLSSCSSATIEGEPVELMAGNVLAVSIRVKLLGLLDYVDTHATVAVRAKGKKKLDGKKSMWEFEVKGQKGARKRQPLAKPIASAASNSTDEPW